MPSSYMHHLFIMKLEYRRFKSNMVLKIYLNFRISISDLVNLKDKLYRMLKPFFAWQNKELHKINPEEVICLSTEGNYTRIYLADKTFYMVRSSLLATLKKIPPDIFIRIHRSFVVSVYHISSIHKDYLVVRDEPLPIAKRYYRSVLAKLNIIE